MSKTAKFIIGFMGCFTFLIIVGALLSGTFIMWEWSYEGKAIFGLSLFFCAIAGCAFVNATKTTNHE